MTLKFGYKVTQDHSNWYHSKAGDLSRLAGGGVVLFGCLFVPLLTNCNHDIVKTNEPQIDFASQGRVRTAIRRDGQFCHSFVANLL